METFLHLHQILNIIYNITKHITVEVKTMATIIAATCLFDNCIFPCAVDPKHGTNNGGPHKWLLFMNELLGNPEKVEGIWPSKS
ncbi:hypothetical protein Lalb_Chr12g0201681 [Lupinus albus]|uniref:Uncharacterized protein n=1 Tax=Lupinus albus TaxID=3870 RepID=A0A6A4PMV6_LUPAL|nr:hypothetical protein Lalb_Chr12g0201681 [Lupinus albus]